VTPRVLDLLDAAGARASFFCIAERARRHAALTREIVARGHSVENHSYHHFNHFGALGPRAMYREVEMAQDCLSDLAGRAPRYFRAVAGLRNPFLDPILFRLNLSLATWTRRAFDTRQRDAQRAARALLRNLAAGDILDMHDGNAARTRAGQPVILEMLPVVLEGIRFQQLIAASLPDRRATP
jgi:peptidoglycan-N-acetylglucosamine deacetylase